MKPLLTNTPNPDTHWPYFTKRLEQWWIVNAPNWQPLVIWIGTETPAPAWRLTAESFAWFYKAVEILCSKGDTQQARDAVQTICEMDRWLSQHGARGKVIDKPTLPEPPKLLLEIDPRLIKADFNSRKNL